VSHIDLLFTQCTSGCLRIRIGRVKFTSNSSDLDFMLVSPIYIPNCLISQPSFLKILSPGFIIFIVWCVPIICEYRRRKSGDRVGYIGLVDVVRYSLCSKSVRSVLSSLAVGIALQKSVTKVPPNIISVDIFGAPPYWSEARQLCSVQTIIVWPAFRLNEHQPN